MPEGHTILRLAKEHQRLFGGGPVHVDSPQGKFAEGAELLTGGRLLTVQAFGKHSLHRFRQLEDGPPRFDLWLHVHLGLYGKWLNGDLPLPDVTGQVRLRIWNDEHFAQLRGATVCEVLTAGAVKTLKARLGEDPLKSRDAGTIAFQKVSRSGKPVGLLLMDQAVMAGVGNVYRAEILFLHKINPYRPGNLLTEEQWQLLWANLIKLMRAGVRSGRIVTTAPADRVHRSGVARQEEAQYVYRRQDLPCRVCGTTILMEEFGGRRLYWCPTCQAL
jgi:endonuclease-8